MALSISFADPVNRRVLHDGADMNHSDYTSFLTHHVLFYLPNGTCESRCKLRTRGEGESHSSRAVYRKVSTGNNKPACAAVG